MLDGDEHGRHRKLAPRRTYQEKPSFARTEMGQVALLADLLKHFVSQRGWQGIGPCGHPNAVLLDQRPSAPDRAEGNLLPGCLELQSIAGFQMHLLSERLRNDDAAGLIDKKSSVHNGINQWVDPPTNAILRGTAGRMQTAPAPAFSYVYRRFVQGVIERIRSRHMLAYHFPDAAPDAAPGTFRDITVTLDGAARKRYPNAELHSA